MAEQDGKTRVYITSAEKDAWLVFPDEESTSCDDRLQGTEAQAVLERTDFRCVSVSTYEHGTFKCLVGR